MLPGITTNMDFITTFNSKRFTNPSEKWSNTTAELLTLMKSQCSEKAYLFMVYLMMLLTAQVIQCQMLGWLVHDELGRMCKEATVAQFHNTDLEELNETTENLSQDTQSLSWELNQRPPKHKTKMLTTWIRCSVPRRGHEQYLCALHLPFISVQPSLSNVTFYMHFNMLGTALNYCMLTWIRFL
jgi:hypothetical protein